MSNFKVLRREQLDAHLKEIALICSLSRPPQGWIKTIREALGMSMRQLAGRVGLTKSAIAAFEHREADGRVTLESLSKLAEGLESELVYFVVPKQTLEETMRHRALELAERLAQTVDETMELEMQRTSAEQRERLVQSLADQLLQTEAKLWDA